MLINEIHDVPYEIVGDNGMSKCNQSNTLITHPPAYLFFGLFN